MKTIATVVLPTALRLRWKALEVQAHWADAYPMLFDHRDIALASGPQGRRGYHLVEWLGAIIAHHLTGYSALVCKYQMPKHREKRAIVEQLGLYDLLLKKPRRFGRQQAPDLLMYAPDLGSWFLCEVKGPGDDISSQEEYFGFLARESGKPVRLIRFSAEREHAGA